jgi:tricorn protease-like protein
MPKQQLKIIAFIILIFSLMIIISCEPISVSVNSKGDVAFTRDEGVFFFNVNTKKLTSLNWNYGKDTIPVIVRWSPKEDMLAYTLKQGDNSTETDVYLINLKGESKKIYSCENVITQLEWSPNAEYISLAKAGDDSDMGVADLVLIKVSDGMSKILASNTGDVHKWYDAATLVYIKVDEKNPDNSDIFKATLTAHKTDTNQDEVLASLMVSKTGGLDCHTAAKTIAFTAIKAGDKLGDFEKDMASDTFAFIYNLTTKKIESLSKDLINFVRYSPDGSKILVKSKTPDDYSSTFNLGFFDVKSKKYKELVKNTCDTVSANSTSVQVYPAWVDNERVLNFRLSNTFGSGGQALQLIGIESGTLKKQNYQALIDTEIFKLVEQQGGF